MNAKQSTRFPAARAWLKAAAFVTLVGTGAVSASASAAHGPFGMHRGHHGAHLENMDPAKLDTFLERRIERRVKDATPEQKARLKEIARAALADLKPLREQARASHQQMHALLTQPNIDRNALERARAQHVQQMDQISQRMMAALADAAQVLTPEQRVRVAEAMKARHARHGKGHGKGHGMLGQHPAPAQ
jgi:Spy/CpxP family protein refolding chaperone